MTQMQRSQTKAEAAIQYAHQAEKLSLNPVDSSAPSASGSTAIRAKFITPLDPVIETADGQRLPAVPIHEAEQINRLKARVDGRTTLSPLSDSSSSDAPRRQQGGTLEPEDDAEDQARDAAEDGSMRELGSALSPVRTHPLFPPLPLYGPPSILRNLQCRAFRISSFFLSTAFLAVVVLGSAFTSIPLMLRHMYLRLTFRNPDKRRPFYEEEKRRKIARRRAAQEWRQQRRRRRSQSQSDQEELTTFPPRYQPTEGGSDPLVCDVGYYARRVGLDVEEFKVQTEDGFIITLWHVYNPKEYLPASPGQRQHRSPNVFADEKEDAPACVYDQYSDGRRRYPVLLMHGLLQSAGAYCTNDEDSLAFFLYKSGYDVWLGNNRCGFKPEHTLLEYYDPRMWAWNIRQMGVMDLPALISRVLSETRFEKLGLICHSQGTTETFVALAKEQRPDLGEKISVFCALAPAVYAGPLIGNLYFKFMQMISPGMFRVIFGIHAFIPLMMTMHRWLPGGLYGAMGYRVFSFLFHWSDDRWERDLRDRMFQFAPVYVSAESMRWWLGRECFAKQRCILATQEEGTKEEVEDEEAQKLRTAEDDEVECPEQQRGGGGGGGGWYNEQVPPFALWVAGSDDLVDGRRLLRRFDKGREPHVRVVWAKVIEEYEHLDVIWAVDAMEKVGKEVRQVLWQTAPAEAREVCRPAEGWQEPLP